MSWELLVAHLIEIFHLMPILGGFQRASLGTQSINNPPAMQERDLGSIPVSGRSPEEEMAIHSSILAWEISWTEELGGLQSMGLQDRIE